MIINKTHHISGPPTEFPTVATQNFGGTPRSLASTPPKIGGLPQILADPPEVCRMGVLLELHEVVCEKFWWAKIGWVAPREVRRTGAWLGLVLFSHGEVGGYLSPEVFGEWE